MGKYTISKEDMLEILGNHGADTTEDTVITDVTQTDNGFDFSLEEKEKEEASSEG